MISQRYYSLNLLYKFQMTKCKSMETPLDRNIKLVVESGIGECELTQYWQLIGSLIYLMIARPNLKYLVGILSQFMQKLHAFTWIALPSITICERNLGLQDSLQDGNANSTQRFQRCRLGRPQDSPSLSEVEPSPRVARSNRPSHFRAQRPNTGARLWLHVKPSSLSES